MSKLLRRILMTGVGFAVAIGCGGGGGSTPIVGTSSPKVGIFLTGTSGTYSHAWVTVRQVTLSSAAGTVTVFQSAVGKVIDLATLNQSGVKKFAALGMGALPPANYTKMAVTMNSTLTVVPLGATQGISKDFEGATGSTKSLEFPANSDGTKDVVANFDMSKWSESAGKVTPVAKSDDGNEVGSGTQETEDFSGSVSNLTGNSPSLTFDLTGEDGPLHVTTDSTTTIANSDGSPNPALSSGSRIQILGTLDTATKTLKATDIKIQIAGKEDPNKVAGAIVSSGTDNFVLTVSRSNGFVPTATTLTVQLSAATVYIDTSGIATTQALFLAALTPGALAGAEGTYDPTANVMIARSVSLAQGHGDGGDHQVHESKVIGAVTAIDLPTNTFAITVSEYEDAVLKVGSTVSVVTNASTVFKNTSLSTITVGMTLNVRGTLSGTTLAATQVQTSSSDGGGG